MDSQNGETIHLLHPDGTVTVRFIASGQEVDARYIIEGGQERQFITDEPGEYITTTGLPAQYILTINSDGELVATGADFITDAESDPPIVFDEGVGILAQAGTDEEEGGSEVSPVTANEIENKQQEEEEMAASMRLVEEEGRGHEIHDALTQTDNLDPIPPELDDIDDPSSSPVLKITESCPEQPEDLPPDSEQRSSVPDETENFVQETIEQDRQHCANCFRKLIFQHGRSKKFSDRLYPVPELPADALYKNFEKLTVQEALEVLFDLKAKSTRSSIRLCEDYVICYKCATSLMRLHRIFADFIEASSSPSFLKSIFNQYEFGVLKQFGPIITEVKSEAEAQHDNEDDENEEVEDPLLNRMQLVESDLAVSLEEARGVTGPGHKTLQRKPSSFLDRIRKRRMLHPASSSSSKESIRERRNEKPLTIQPKVEKPAKSKVGKGTSSGRFPRSCKRKRNYRALAKVGSCSDSSADYDSDAPEEQVIDNTTVLPAPPVNELGEDDSSHEFFDTGVQMQMKTKKRNRLTVSHLKRRIQMLTEDSPLEPEPVVKRKPGRPRKIKIEPEQDAENIEIKVEPPLAFLDTSDNERMKDPLGTSEPDDDVTKMTLSLQKLENAASSTSHSPYSIGCSLKRRKRKAWNEKDWSFDQEDSDAGDMMSENEENDITGETTNGNTRTNRRGHIKCADCCATFQRHSHYSEHLAVHSEQVISCLECRGTFNSVKNLRRHLSLYHRADRVGIGRRKASQSHRADGERPPPRHYSCPECSFSFTRLYHLKGHLVNQHQRDPDTVIGSFPCPVCPRTFTCDFHLQAHLSTKHLVRIREMKNECDECGRKFLKKSDLDNHMTTHTNIRSFMCEICGYSSKRPQDLTRHRKLVHTKEVKHICQTCGKGFLSLWQLKSHQLSHDAEKKFPCTEPGCGKFFRCPNNLRQHVQVHQGVKHVCQFCGESYTRTAYLARHISTNHDSASVPKRTRGPPVPIPDFFEEDGSSPVVEVEKVPKGRKQKKTYQLLENVIQIMEPEPMELDLDLPSEDGSTQQVILHGFDDRYDGVIMEYVIS